ncbi:MAG: hypothetical protein HY665_09160 [Chloroflexi bacterium]|nr:hypothetical protein [Chloroflexota bacterium]
MTTTEPRKSKKSGLKRTTIFLTEEHHETLRRLAFERRTSMANLIREAVLEMLEDDQDIREVTKTRDEGHEGYIALEKLDRRYKELHKLE